METKTVGINESVDFILKGKGTAGYTWQYTLNPANIVSASKKKSLEKSSNPIPGSSVDEIFTITALKKGTVKLRFYLVRTWESDSAKPLEEKNIEITVK